MLHVYNVDFHWIIVTFILLVINILTGYMAIHRRLFGNITRAARREKEKYSVTNFKLEKNHFRLLSFDLFTKGL
jgi:hypothetical protein